MSVVVFVYPFPGTPLNKSDPMDSQDILQRNKSTTNMAAIHYLKAVEYPAHSVYTNLQTALDQDLEKEGVQSSCN